MSAFETLVGLLLAAVALAALARRVGAPYPAFLAIGGAVLAFIPGAPISQFRPISRWRCSSRRSCSTRPSTRRRGI